jgi:hypothetical protein
MKTQRIPQTDSVEELAAFWDRHDLTDFEDQMEEVAARVFVRGKAATVAIKLRPKEVHALRRVAQSEGVKESALVRQWVLEKLGKIFPVKPPNTPLQPVARKTRRG